MCPLVYIFRVGVKMTTRFVEPSVYLIGESMVNSDGLNGYLTHVGAPEWTTDAQSDNERLTEVFSRSCYKSFKPGLNPNVTKVREGNKAHLANILNVDNSSVMEHAWASFMICDISRIFTHELVRHRVGIAISQESLRYVRLEDLRLVLPRIFADDREALIIMDTAVRAAEAAYGHLLVRAAEIQNKSFDDLPFSIKKKYTSAMRRIAPDGIATNIGWSCNMRALRHILQLRTDPSAEEEIRHVFGNLIAPIAMSRWPNLFQDLVSEEIDGYPCIHKVKES